MNNNECGSNKITHQFIHSLSYYVDIPKNSLGSYVRNLLLYSSYSTRQRAFLYIIAAIDLIHYFPLLSEVLSFPCCCKFCLLRPNMVLKIDFFTSFCVNETYYGELFAEYTTNGCQCLVLQMFLVNGPFTMLSGDEYVCNLCSFLYGLYAICVLRKFFDS